MVFFAWLENTALAVWVGESLWAYPLMLSLHAVGLAMVAGIAFVLGLRLLGLFPGIPAESLPGLIKLAWAGFAVNALSGAALFSSQATIFVENAPFLIKAACIALGVACLAFAQRRLGRTAAIDGAMRLAGGLSLCLWTAAIFAGRLIAYL